MNKTPKNCDTCKHGFHLVEYPFTKECWLDSESPFTPNENDNEKHCDAYENGIVRRHTGNNKD